MKFFAVIFSLLLAACANEVPAPEPPVYEEAASDLETVRDEFFVAVPVFPTIGLYQEWAATLGWAPDVVVVDPDFITLDPTPEHYFISFDGPGYISSLEDTLWLEIVDLSHELDKEAFDLAILRLENRIASLSDRLHALTDSGFGDDIFIPGETYCLLADIDGCVSEHPIEAMLELLISLRYELTGSEAFG